MRWTLHRYVLREITLPFVAGLLFLTQMFFVGRLLAEAEAIFGAGIRLWDVGKVLFYILPSMLAYGIPVGFLLGVLIGFGRLGDDHELVALASTGTGPLALLPMPLALGAVATAMMLAITCWLEPIGLQHAGLVVREVLTRNLAGDIRPGVFYQDLSDLTLFATSIDKESGRLEGVVVEDAREEGAPILVFAREGRIDAEGREAALTLRLSDGELHRARDGRDYAVATFEDASVSVVVEEEISQKSRFRRNTDTFTPWQVLDSFRWWRDVRGVYRYDRLVEFHKRFAYPFVTLALAVVGVAAGSTVSGRRKTGKMVALVWTLASVVGYFVADKIFTTFGNRGVIPPWLAAWTPVLLILAAGTFTLMYRRYRGNAG